MAVAAAGEWRFAGVRVQPDQGVGGLLVYGEAINESGSPQRVLGIQGRYLDGQGQTVTPQEVSDYWPIEVVPPGWPMPFELTLVGPTTIDRLDLTITAESVAEPLRMDLEVSALRGTESDDDYCVSGEVGNPGQPLDEYLMVVAVLYDEDDRVLNWGIGYEQAASAPAADETLAVSACAERFFFDVARYELRAWGK